MNTCMRCEGGGKRPNGNTCPNCAGAGLEVNDAEALDDLERIAHWTLELGTMTRLTKYAGEHERVTTHSHMLALMALYVGTKLDPTLHTETLLIMALVHDLVEAYAGDTPTLRPLTESEKAAKEAGEAAGLEKLWQDLPGIAAIVALYEHNVIREAQVVRVLDKLAPKLVHLWDPGAAAVLSGMSREDVATRVHEQLGEMAESCPDAGIALRLLRNADPRYFEAWDAKQPRDEKL